MMALRWDDLIKLLLVKKLADHGGAQQDQTPTHEEPAPSMRRRPISEDMDMFHLLHTHHPGLMSSLCLPEDERLPFDQKSKVIGDRLVAKLALLRAQAHSQEAGQALADHGGAQELGGAEGSSNEGCLRDEEREMMIPATENALNHLPSLKQSSSARGKAYGLSNGARHLRSHACKPVCAKKDACGGKGTLGKLIDTDSGEEPFELVGATSRTSLEEVKMKIAAILKVYMETRDTKEAFRCIRELGVSFFHYEVVKMALITGVESYTAEPLVLNLLKEAVSENLISSTHMVKGFSSLRESLDDLALDIPSAEAKFGLLVGKAVSGGWLDASFSYPSGQSGRKQVED